MRVKFIGTGDPTDSAICTAFGQVFPKGEWVSVDGNATKLASNPVFEVEGAAMVAPKAAEPEAGRDDIEIPADWESLTWGQRRSLASKLTDDPVKDGDDARVAIEAALAVRAIKTQA